jgi:hypothetical protein
LLEDAYKAVIAVEQFRPEIKRHVDALISRSESDVEDDLHVFVTDEERQALEEFVKTLDELTSDVSDIHLHRAWRAAYELGGQLDQAVVGIYQELPDGDGRDSESEVEEYYRLLAEAAGLGIPLSLDDPHTPPTIQALGEAVESKRAGGAMARSGIRTRHSRGGPSRDGGECRQTHLPSCATKQKPDPGLCDCGKCTPSYEASVWDWPQEGEVPQDVPALR